ncbi:MAG TPA: nitronate monooxygenase, partial [Dehalococcoidia bacterium]|nr:nitronate monooxygenase [Dehalococcoidia bacterium]
MVTLRELFGIELPIIQAPMASAQDSALAIAVTNAGGLGSVPCALLSPDGVRAELSTMRQHARGPFSVNFFCNAPPKRDESRDAAWRAALAPYYREYEMEPGDPGPGRGGGPFSADAVDVLEEFRPAVVSFHFGLPPDNLLGRVKSLGAKVIASATTVDEAMWLEARGVDAIIAQGVEAGGHRGMFLTDDITTQVGTLALVPQIASAVGVPVIAAGGIASGRGVAAAMALGAAGVQVGTAYLLCQEALTSPMYRAALSSTAARH